MTDVSRPLVAGNWKMNGLKASLGELAAIGQGAGQGAGEVWRKADLLICPPATLVFPAAAAMIGSKVAIGAQDCHAAASGAHTGDISAEMLADAGASAIIVGHSERRADHGETDAIVLSKAEAAWRAGLTAIICIGETRAEREIGATLEICSRQIAGSVPRTATHETVVIAYEPVWAIGTGLTPTAADVAAAHLHIRKELAALIGAEAQRTRILYGGSVKPANARELLHIDNVNGALVGGASLKAADFLGIADAYRVA